MSDCDSGDVIFMIFALIICCISLGIILGYVALSGYSHPPDYWDGYFDRFENREYDPGTSDISYYDDGWSDATDEVIDIMIAEELNRSKIPTPEPDESVKEKTIKESESQFEKLKMTGRFY